MNWLVPEGLSIKLIVLPHKMNFNYLYSNMYSLLGKVVPIVLLAITVNIVSCNQANDNKNAKGPVYVKPSIDKNGRYRKGHVRMPVSTKKDAAKSRARSKYYYQTRGKYRKK